MKTAQFVGMYPEDVFDFNQVFDSLKSSGIELRAEDMFLYLGVKGLCVYNHRDVDVEVAWLKIYFGFENYSDEDFLNILYKLEVFGLLDVYTSNENTKVLIKAKHYLYTGVEHIEQ